jgi:enoyl-[acyl-carrier protein] reductase I
MVIERFDESLKKVASHAPLLRCVTAQDVGNAAVFYAADASNGVTGTVVHLDGGMEILMGGGEAHPRAAERNPE